MPKGRIYQNHVMDKMLGQTDWTPPVGLYLALYTTAPTADGGGVEVTSAGAYARVPVANDDVMWPPADGGAKENAVTISFATATGPWGDVVAFALHTDPVGDTLYLWGTLDAPVTVDTDDLVQFEPLDLTVQEV